MHVNGNDLGSRRPSILGRSAVVLMALSIACSGCGPMDDEQAIVEELDEGNQAVGTTYRLGPTRQIKSFKDLPALRPGDVVEVDGNATYPGDIRITRGGTATDKVTIRGVRVSGKRPVLKGGVNTIELAANHIVFEGFEVTGGSFRCIFHHGHDITIRDSVIHDCPAHGILGADADSGSLTMEYVELYKCGSGTTKHCVYMATDERAYPGSVFRMQHSYIHDTNGGNAVKSRAERNEIYYNWIEGGLYKELELIGPDGQDPKLAREDSDVVGNVFRKTHTQFVVRIGGDGTGDTKGRYRFVNNTFLLMKGSSAAIHLFDGIESVELHNNVFYRVGGGSVEVFRDDAKWVAGSIIKGVNNAVPTGTKIPAGFTGTLVVDDPGFTDVAKRDVTLRSTSPLRNKGVSSTSGPAGRAFPRPLALPLYHPPKAALAAVGSAAQRPTDGSIDIGAFEYASGAQQPSTTPTTPTTPTPPPTPPASSCPVANPGEWVNVAMARKTGSFSVTWDVTPSGSNIDGVLGLSRNAADHWTDLAAIVLFDVGGTVQVRNGSTYPTSSFRYRAGVTYRIRMVVNVLTKRYSVYIRPAGGSEQQLASNFAFRTEQASVSELNTWSVSQHEPTGTLKACLVSIL